MLKVEDAFIKENNKYYFRCAKCTKIIQCKPYYLNKHSGLCRSCVMKKRPYEHIYKRFCNTAKTENHKNELSYEDFLNFTKQSNCHYCLKSIPWMEYCYFNNRYTRGGYFLDRMDNKKGYSNINCVVCCTNCNKAKGNRYTYEEWYGMTEYFRKKVLA